MRILQLTPATLQALASHDVDRARSLAPVELTDFVLHAPDCLDTWRIRAEQVARTPRDAEWTTGLLYDEQHGVVGQGGFHAAPDGDGAVEIGYDIDPAFRGRGYGKQTVRWLIERARAAEQVKVVRALISPSNLPSLALISAFPFEKVGEEMDEIDGLEWIFELKV